MNWRKRPSSCSLSPRKCTLATLDCSAAIAVLMDSRLAAQGLNFSPSEAGGGNLPQQVFSPFADAMSQAMLLPAAVLVIGLVAALSFARPKHLVRPVGAHTATVPATAASQL